MTKLIITTLLSTLSLWAAMHMQTIPTKKVVVGTFKTADALNSAKRILASNSTLQRIQQQNSFVMTVRTNADATTLILEKFKNMRTALNAFVAVSKHYPKAYLIDDSYTVAVEGPQTPPQYEPPVTTAEDTAIPFTPTITEAMVTATATTETAQTPAPKTVSPIMESASDITEKDDEPVVIVVTEAGSEAERYALERALQTDDSYQKSPRKTEAEETEEEDVVITEIEEIPFDEPNTTITSSATEEMTEATDSTVIENSTLD